MPGQKQSLLSQLLDGASELIKRPFVEKKIIRAFDAADESIEEQLVDLDVKIANARENIVKVAKDNSNLSASIQSLIQLQIDKKHLSVAREALKIEKTELFS